jgi:hypothetical protein
MGIDATNHLGGSGSACRHGYQQFNSIVSCDRGLIIIVVMPMTVVAPVPVPVRIIAVIILAIVMWIITPVIHRIRIAISGPDIYIKEPARLRSLRQESSKPKH